MITCAIPAHPDAPKIITRHLHLGDIPALLELEYAQWNREHAASEAALRQRMLACPELCVGAFCGQTGKALTSMFMKPVEETRIRSIRSWDECAENDHTAPPVSSSRSLFGISITSIHPDAMNALSVYIWPKVIEAGWEELYLGSPMPGLHNALRQDPSLSAINYAMAKRRSLPRDAQLRYYHHKGMSDIVAVLPGYFPHAQALDYGVLLRGNLRDIAARAMRKAARNAL
jgi:hypothetical protein